MKYLVEVKPPKEKDIYLERSYATIIKSEAKFGYKENCPVILAEISETDFSYTICCLTEQIQSERLCISRLAYELKNGEISETHYSKSLETRDEYISQLQSAISILKHLST